MLVSVMVLRELEVNLVLCEAVSNRSLRGVKPERARADMTEPWAEKP